METLRLIRVLARANITSNVNPIPSDSLRPAEWVGMRLGASAATTRGMKEEEFLTLGNVIADLIDAESVGRSDAVLDMARAKVAELTKAFPIYRH